MTPSGDTVRANLERAARPGKLRAESARATLAAHPCPPVFAPFAREFRELSRWRPSGGFGPAPLTLQDIEAYERRLRGGRPFLPGELRLIKRLDLTVLAPSPAPDAPAA